MQSSLEQSLQVMANAFRKLEDQVPAPESTKHGNGFVFRYKEQLIEQAILQKLAKAISGLAASQVLLANGYAQEHATLNRIVDELGEDVFFLAAALTNDKLTPLHERFLASFWAEEYSDPDDIVGTHKARDIVPRKKIRAYTMRVLGEGIELSRATTTGNVLHKMYSGFVHGASPQIMELCVGNPPRFMLFGMTGTPRIREHFDDSWNYHYRTLTAVTVAAKAFGDGGLVDAMYAYLDQFEEETGRTGKA